MEQLNKLKKTASAQKANVVNSNHNNGKGRSDKWQPSLPETSELNEHPAFPSLCDSIGIRFEEGRGRFCVAERDIKAGMGKDLARVRSSAHDYIVSQVR